MRDRAVIEGERVRLEPLNAEHLNALRESANDPALWEYTFQPNPFSSPQSATRWLDETMAQPNVQAFAIVDKRSSAVAGSTRFLDISQEHRKLEIGYTFIARRYWRSHVNTETKLVLLREAFEHRNMVRVQFKAEAINERSHRAILRIGATCEGTLRNFRIRDDGEVRDVRIYSVIERDWPQVKAHLLALLSRDSATGALE